MSNAHGATPTPARAPAYDWLDYAELRPTSLALARPQRSLVGRGQPIAFARPPGLGGKASAADWYSVFPTSRRVHTTYIWRKMSNVCCIVLCGLDVACSCVSRSMVNKTEHFSGVNLYLYKHDHDARCSQRTERG